MGQRKERQVLLAASIFGALAAVGIGKVMLMCLAEKTIMETALFAVPALVCATLCVVCMDIWNLRPADSHSLRTLLCQYMALVALRLKMPYLKWFIRQTTMHPKEVNEKSLLQILNKNKDTVYGMKYKFGEMKSREDFVRMHPITSPEDFQCYVERIMQGEKNVLYPEDTYFLISTSGTTGEAKMYAFVKEHVTYCKFQFGQLFSATVYHLLNLQRMTRFHIYSRITKSPGGLPMTAASQLIFINPQYNIVPFEYSKLYTEEASYYAQAVFSLAERELGYISSFSADLMYSYMKFITEHWDHLCEDISQGEIGTHINMPEDVRRELSKHLTADPERASDLLQAMQKGVVGLAKRIWPTMAFIVMGKSAAFKMCADYLVENYFHGLKIIGMVHGATEGVTGINMESEPEVDEVLTLVPYPAFEEFIPIENVKEEQPKTVFPEEWQLRVGGLYEVVHTNMNGLYRCRYGDIIQIVGFTNKTPKYQFMYKLGQRLNVAYERTPDRFLYGAIRDCQSNLPPDVRLVNYTTTESVAIEQITGQMTKAHYVFFFEFDTDEVLSCKELSGQIDQSLQSLYQPYRRYKDAGNIGPLHIVQVKRGTFEGVKSLVWNNTPHGQFKMPRVMRRRNVLTYLVHQAVH